MRCLVCLSFLLVLNSCNVSGGFIKDENLKSTLQDFEARILEKVNNVEIQANNLESQLINVREKITDNEDQIFGKYCPYLNFLSMFSIQL